MPDRRDVRYFDSPDPDRRHRASRLLSPVVDQIQAAADSLAGDGRDVGSLRAAAEEIKGYLERMRRWGS